MPEWGQVRKQQMNRASRGEIVRASVSAPFLIEALFPASAISSISYRMCFTRTRWNRYPRLVLFEVLKEGSKESEETKQLAWLEVGYAQTF